MKRNFFLKIPAVHAALCAIVLSAALLAGPGAAQAASKRLAVFPFEILSDKPMDFLKKGVRTMLASRLGGSGITIIDEAEVAGVLEAASIETVTDRDAAADAAAALDADYALYGTITTAAGGYSLDLAFLNLTADPPKVSRLADAGAENQLIPRLAQVAGQVRGLIEGRPEAPAYGVAPGTAPESPAGPYEGLFSSFDTGPATEGPAERGLFHRTRDRSRAFSPTGSFPVHLGPMGFDIADLNGNGVPEILVVGRKSLLIYGERDGRYVPLDRLDSPFGEDFLKVSAADINGSGRPEIYLVGRYGARARTTVYEWQGSFKQIDSIRGHLCVVSGAEGMHPMLVYQESKVGEFLSGPLRRVAYGADGKPAVGEEIPGLSGARLYSLARGDLDGNGAAEWVGVDENKRLTLWSADGAVLWRGSTRISGSNNAILAGEITGQGDLPPSIEFDPRMVVTDLNDDGTNEVLAVRNIPITERVIEYLVYLKSSITAYRMEGNRLVGAWNTGEIPYCLTDLKVYEGTIYVSAERGKIEKVTQGSGRIMWFE